MLAPPTVTVELGGHTWHVRPPARALDVLEVSVYQYARLAAQGDQLLPSEQNLRMVYNWVAEHITGGSAAIGAPNMARVLDEYLTWPELLELREAIVEAASLPAEMVEGVREYWRISAGGGCECPSCRDGKELGEKRKKALCMYEQVSVPARHLASQVVGFTEDPDPEQPFWLFQLKQARLYGKLEARAQQARERREKKKKQQALKERGLI